MPRTTHRTSAPVDHDVDPPDVEQAAALAAAPTETKRPRCTTQWWLHVPAGVPLDKASPDWSAPPFSCLPDEELWRRKRAFAEWRRQQCKENCARRRKKGGAAAASVVDAGEQLAMLLPLRAGFDGEMSAPPTMSGAAGVDAIDGRLVDEKEARQAAQRRAAEAEQRAADATRQIVAEREDRERVETLLRQQLRSSEAARAALEERVAALDACVARQGVAAAAPGAWSPQAELERERAKARETARLRLAALQPGGASPRSPAAAPSGSACASPGSSSLCSSSSPSPLVDVVRHVVTAHTTLARSLVDRLL